MVAIKITDPDALDKLTEVEGEAWRLKQDADVDSPYGFHMWKRWFEMLEQLRKAHPTFLSGEVMRDNLAGSKGLIQGEDGQSQWTIGYDGTIALLPWSVSPEKRLKAIDVGFAVILQGSAVTLQPDAEFDEELEEREESGLQLDSGF